MATGSGISNSLVGKNLAFFKPKKKGLLISIFGAVVVIFGGIFSTGGEKLISPSGYTLNNEEFYPGNIAERTYLYFILGFIIIPISGIIFILFIFEYKKGYDSEKKEQNNEKEKKEDIEDNGNKDDENLINKDVEKNNDNDNENNINTEIENMSKKKNLKSVFKTFRFWRLAFSQLFVSFSFSFILGTGRTFGALIGIDGTSLQFLMLLQSAALIVIGPILGFISDKKGPLPIIRLSPIICIIPDILLLFFAENTIIFITSFVLSILGLVSGIVGFAPFIMEIYGIQESVIIAGAINVFAKISEIISTISDFVISLYYTNEELINPYRIMYIIGAICCAISLILLLFEKDKKYVYENDEENLGNLVEKGRFTVTSSNN